MGLGFDLIYLLMMIIELGWEKGCLGWFSGGF